MFRLGLAISLALYLPVGAQMFRLSAMCELSEKWYPAIIGEKYRSNRFDAVSLCPTVRPPGPVSLESTLVQI
ncbi:hypothetical protein D3C72_1922080 [compost metagenome]